ncbi:MAG TPA: hypothetical protein VHT29_10200 [Solirubrobacteraceae bacterium]|jgi:anti-sigma28 factor (negative regulator of flagellin synthesis)|nr:hypothetical protein [Solirubrobacteraceae bacterium]
MPGLLWDSVAGRPNPALKAGTVTLIAVAVVIAAFVATASGGSSPAPPSFVPPVSTPESAESTPTTPESSESTSSTQESTSTTTDSTVESSTVQQVLNEYESDYSGENVEGLKSAFSSNLVRQDGSHAPEGLSQALETYKHQFNELKNPSYSLSGVSIQPGNGEATASGQFTITDQNGTVTGSITFHMVEENERLLIDKLTITHSK